MESELDMLMVGSNQESLSSKMELISDHDENFRLFHLNDDCLSHVLSFLQLEDQFSLARLAKRLNILLSHHYRVHKTFQLSMINLDPLFLMEVQNFLIKNGKAIESFNLSGSLDQWNEKIPQLFHFALKFCPHLNCLMLDSIPFNRGYYSENIAKLYPEMKMLELIDCELSNNDIKNFSKLSKIKILKISGILNEFTGEYFENFKNLKKLELVDCYYISEVNFMRMCQNFENLKFLNICGIALSAKPFQLISNVCHHLETIEISIYKEDLREHVKHLRKISGLRNLTIGYSEPKNINTFLTELGTTELIIYLDKLCLRFYPSHNMFNIFAQLENCQNLKEIFEKSPDEFSSSLDAIWEKLKHFCNRLEGSSSTKHELAMRFNKVEKEKRLGRETIFKFKCVINKGFSKIFKNPGWEYTRNMQIVIEIFLPILWKNIQS